MSVMAPRDVTTVPCIAHGEAMHLQEVELQRALDLLRTLDAAQWSAATACPDWDVRRMWLHVLGACEAGASIRENLHQMRAGNKRRRQLDVPLEAGLSGVQVAEREEMTPEHLVDRLERIAPRTVRGRRRIPRIVRAVKIPVDGPVIERWSLGYLVDVIYLRDLWMHRLDTCQAIGRDPVLSADHDGRIVADVVAEWARRHARPFTLELTGPAGGIYTAGQRGEHIVMDATEFCWVLAGRGQGAGLLATIVPF